MSKALQPAKAHKHEAIVVHHTGGPEVLTFEDVPAPVLTGGDVLIQTTAIGINYIDTYHRSGVYPLPLPFIPGQEAAGKVVEVAADVTGINVGDAVAWPMNPGSYAEIVRVPADKLVPIPAGLSHDVAAAVMLQGMTAHYLVNSTFQVEPHHTVLVHAAAGGVGQILTQLAKFKGATVIATASTDAKVDIARANGADHVIRYDREDFAVVARELTDGAGVDVVYDGVGKDTFDGSLASLTVRGMLVLFGGASGQVPPVDLQRLSAGGSLYVTRPTLGHYLRTPEELRWRSHDLLGLAATGELSVAIGATYDLKDAAAAHTDLEARRTTGKLLLRP